MAASETLCCCEYENKDGERSHILACCCDCEAFDQIADRCLKCEHVPSSLIDRFLDTLRDRCRFPGIAGGGAVRVNFEIATPIVVLPLSLTLAALGPISTCLVLGLLPCFCVFFYHTWKRRSKKSRTKFFFVWGLTSLIIMYFLFEMVICSNTHVSFLDNVLVSVAVIGMLVALRFAKTDPGVIPDKKLQQYLQESYGWLGFYHDTLETAEDDVEDFEVVHMEDVPSTDEEAERSNKGSNQSGRVDNWCANCDIVKPPRSGHCSVCSVCIRNRDHHCVWIDSCIGSENHRSFLIAMALFVVIGYYGSYVTLSSICDTAWQNNGFCYRTAYRDFRFGLCFVSAWYTILVCTMMLIGLVHQVLLISQNCTSQELHTANKLGNSRWFIYRLGNPHNQGLLQNWRDFVFKKRTSLYCQNV